MTAFLSVFGACAFGGMLALIFYFCKINLQYKKDNLKLLEENNLLTRNYEAIIQLIPTMSLEELEETKLNITEEN